MAGRHRQGHAQDRRLVRPAPRKEVARPVPQSSRVSPKLAAPKAHRMAGRHRQEHAQDRRLVRPAPRKEVARPVPQSSRVSPKLAARNSSIDIAEAP
jgi:hypothetical protein